MTSFEAYSNTIEIEIVGSVEGDRVKLEEGDGLTRTRKWKSKGRNKPSHFAVIYIRVCVLRN